MRKIQKTRMRKSTKYIYLIIAITLSSLSLISLVNNFSQNNISTKTQEIYKYTNKFNYDYNVNLINNEYISGEKQNDKTLVYVTNLIDTINLNLDYKYIGSRDSNLKCKYSVIGKTKVLYSKNGEMQKILDEDEVILEEREINKFASNLDIDENINLNLKEKNELLNRFKQNMGMSIDAEYSVILKVEVLTDIEEKEVLSQYTSEIKIGLADKTTKLTGDNNKEDTQYISKQYEVSTNKNVAIIILDLVLLIISLVLLRNIMKSSTMNIVKNEFRQQLNRILKLCQDKIVQISTKPNDDPANVVYVKDFGEIVKISEELFKPILYYLDNQKEEAYFSVMTGNNIYRYILKN